ncbi:MULTISPECIES: alpha/beta hydrolase family protein [Legionella]|uniref:Alpha/beta hydrolase n=1 Tax=Legionella septentrionalis TaxID=2498109 RepID=A0A433JJH2_9GAMM|nr:MULTISPECIES: alpha/beta hydrolase [Legionella]MCP0913713.1 alpha/beta hydrolase [Legionella sp. 27cVA30]RUQ85422.1 alpha/beta hydrolase [Legionella septentrionalis]RUR09611.1 alpha/beta hydrolase [Legionella septentrionalis]RUR14813.1 alpha/beta hydrolase [Legionella septentrionalis]
MNDISRGNIRVRGFANEEMDFQLLRQLGATSYGAASVGECFNLSAKIADGNPKNWVQEFTRLAEWQKNDGLERLLKNHIISGREQLFKACNSFRAAEYYSPCASEQHRTLGLNSADCFRTAISTLDIHFETHSITYQDIAIPIYFFSPANDGVQRKTVLMVSGFDGTMEEEFFMRGWAAIERNYNVIHFAGPGQMDVFRQYPTTFFQPDFEQVVSKVIDHIAFRQEVNMNKLALVGISIGGYFATRAAAHEPRIKALVANSPILDVYAYLTSFVPGNPLDIPDDHDFTLADIPFIPDTEFPVELKARTEQLLMRYGRHSFKNTFKYLQEFQVGEAINNITCPCLGLIGTAEGEEPRKQFAEFCRQVRADSYEFNDFEGASTHCQVGNVSFANAVMYDWLDQL